MDSSKQIEEVLRLLKAMDGKLANIDETLESIDERLEKIEEWVPVNPIKQKKSNGKSLAR